MTFLKASQRLKFMAAEMVTPQVTPRDEPLSGAAMVSHVYLSLPLRLLQVLQGEACGQV